jgi:RNA polymerase sigma-70 factor (ECF subfamily)
MTDESEDLEELLQRAKRCEHAAVSELLERYRVYLNLLARIHVDKTLQAKVDASDLVQETMIRAYPRFSTFSGSGERELVGWLRSVLAATAIDMARRYRGTQRRNVSLERRLADSLNRSSAAMEQLVSPTSSPSQHVVGREAAVVLADRLAKLPDVSREAIVLHYLEGRSIAEVAEHLGRSPQATNSLLARALVKLRLLMKDTHR